MQQQSSPPGSQQVVTRTLTFSPNTARTFRVVGEVAEGTFLGVHQVDGALRGRDLLVLCDAKGRERVWLLPTHAAKLLRAAKPAPGDHVRLEMTDRIVTPENGKVSKRFTLQVSSAVHPQ